MQQRIVGKACESQLSARPVRKIGADGGQSRKLRASLAVAALCLAASPASGQNDQPSLDELLEVEREEAAEQTQEADPSAETPGPTEPTEDGEGDADAQPEDTGPASPDELGDPIEAELERMLETETSGDPFASAIQQMQAVARRLGQRGELGPDVQRQQEQIIKKLDQVLAKAQQQQQGGGGQSGQQNQQRQPSGQRQQQGGGQSGSEQQQTSAGQQPGQNPGGASGRGNPSRVRESDPMESVRKGWGGLPPRLRDELSEGLGEEFSPVYESLTESYYRRLAEQMQQRMQDRQP
jgi:hypothetical protein